MPDPVTVLTHRVLFNPLLPKWEWSPPRPSEGNLASCAQKESQAVTTIVCYSKSTTVVGVRSDKEISPLGVSKLGFHNSGVINGILFYRGCIRYIPCEPARPHKGLVWK